MLVDESKYCVVGEIVKLDSNYFWLEVKRSIYGDITQGTIPILRFEDWTCAQRSKPYEVGQKELVFFDTTTLNNRLVYYGHGAADEFEIPLLNDTTVAYRSRIYDFIDLKNLAMAISDYRRFKPTIAARNEGNIELQRRQLARISPAHDCLFSEVEIPKMDADSEHYRYYYHDAAMISDTSSNVMYQNCNNIIELDIPKAPGWQYFISSPYARFNESTHIYTLKPDSSVNKLEVSVKRTNTKGDTQTVLSRSFRVLPIPKPTIYVNACDADTVCLSDIYLMTLAPKRATSGQTTHWRYFLYRCEVEATISGQRLHCDSHIDHYRVVIDSFAKQIKPGDKIRFYNIKALSKGLGYEKVEEKTFYICACK